MIVKKIFKKSVSNFPIFLISKKANCRRKRFCERAEENDGILRKCWRYFEKIRTVQKSDILECRSKGSHFATQSLGHCATCKGSSYTKNEYNLFIRS